MRVMPARPATADDAREIACVHVRTWQVAYAHVFPEAELSGLSIDRRAERWREVLSQPDIEGSTVVVDDGDDIIGFASVGPARDESPEVGELYAMYVRPDFWGGGFGRSLMESALAWLREGGYRRAILWVLEDNPRARRFYEFAGWRVDGAAKDEPVLGVDVRHVRYFIDLSSAS